MCVCVIVSITYGYHLLGDPGVVEPAGQPRLEAAHVETRVQVAVVDLPRENMQHL